MHAEKCNRTAQSACAFERKLAILRRTSKHASRMMTRVCAREVLMMLIMVTSLLNFVLGREIQRLMPERPGIDRRL